MTDETIVDVKNLNLWYGEKQALFDVTLPVKKNTVTALIGPSGCGKSTLLRCINRMNESTGGCRIEGTVTYRGENIYGKNVDVNSVRTKIGMIFQKPNPFPSSIRDNVVYGPKIHGTDRKEYDALTEDCLRKAALWEETKDRLNKSAMGLSGGQQQRLCIARALAVSPDVILMDEPTSALDPIATSKIEELISELKKDYTVIIVTHNMQQAARISDRTGFMYMGKMIELGKTDDLFGNPREELTERYLTGRFG